MPGMSRGRVERIFGAGGGCAYVTYAVGDVRYVSRQYRQGQRGVDGRPVRQKGRNNV